MYKTQQAKKIALEKLVFLLVLAIACLGGDIWARHALLS